jgi:hypothetical protein
MAFLADLFRGVDTRRMVLGTLAPGSTVPRFTSIPASGPYTDWDTTAIAPDGAVWRSLACRGVLSRTSPRGEERRIHLPPIRCHEAFRIGYGAAFAFGADGSVWFASLCQARIVRIPLVGPRREWRLARRRHCERSTDELVQLHPMLLATPDGGVRFEGGRIDGRGRLVHDSAPLPDAVGSDGTEWRFEPDAITSRAPDGRVRRLPVPAEQDARIIAGALGADGRFWYLSAATVSYERQGSYNVNAHVGVTDADGALTDRPLPPSDGLSPRLAPSPDGSMWLLAGRSLQHVAAAPSPPLELRRQARVTRFLARRGATVWIQVRCSAPPGTYCTSVAKLFASWARIAVHRVRFAVPAGEARAIPLTLTRRAMARLHKQGHLDPYTAIDVGGGYVAGRIHVR